MARRFWKDRVVEKPRTYNIQNNPDGTVTLVPTPGVIVETGTPVNASNLNGLEEDLDTHKADNVQHGAILGDDNKRYQAIIGERKFVELNQSLTTGNVIKSITSDSQYIYAGVYGVKGVVKLDKQNLNVVSENGSLLGYVSTLLVDGDNIYVGFSNSNILQVLNKTTLLPVKQSANLEAYEIHSIKTDTSYIYISTQSQYIIKLDKNTLQQVSKSALLSGTPKGIVLEGGHVYSGGIQDKYVVKLRGDTLTELNRSPDIGHITSLVKYADFIYAGSSSRIYKLNSTDLSVVSQKDIGVSCIGQSDDALFVGRIIPKGLLKFNFDLEIEGSMFLTTVDVSSIHIDNQNIYVPYTNNVVAKLQSNIQLLGLREVL